MTSKDIGSPFGATNSNSSASIASRVASSESPANTAPSSTQGTGDAHSSASQSSSSKQGKPRAPRISLACQTCRSQKMKCSGGKPCERCRRGGHKCLYEAAQRGRKNQFSQNSQLAKRAEALEGRINQLESERGPSLPFTPSQPSLTCSQAEFPLAAPDNSALWNLPTASDASTHIHPPANSGASAGDQAGFPMLGLDAFLYAAGSSQAPNTRSSPLALPQQLGDGQTTFSPMMTTAGQPGATLSAGSSAAGQAPSPSSLGASNSPVARLSSPKRYRAEYEEDDRQHYGLEQDNSFRASAEDDMPFFRNPALNRIDRLETLGNWENDSSWALMAHPPSQISPNFPVHQQQQQVAHVPMPYPDDLVSKGVLTEELLQRFWWRFHEVCAFRLGWANEGGTINVARRESKLLIAASCSVGARSLQAHADALNCLNEAKLQARQLIFYSDLKSSPADYLQLKGLLILAVYWALPHTMSQIVSVAHSMGLHGIFAKLTDPAIRGSSDEGLLMQKGRVWILITIYSHLDSLFYNQASPIQVDFKLLRKQCDILRSSSNTRSQMDGCLACHAHLLGLLADIQRQFQGRQQDEQTPRAVAGHMQDLEHWWTYWSAGGQSSPFSTKDIEYFLTAYQLAQLYICANAFSPAEDGRFIAAHPERIQFARQAMICAKTVLDTSLDTSRRAPPQGLAIDFALTGMGFALSKLFALAFMLPSEFDLADIRHTLTGLFASFYAPEVSHYAPMVSTLLMKYDALIVANRQTPQPLPPQRLDPDSQSLIEVLASDPAFYQCVLSEPWETF